MKKTILTITGSGLIMLCSCTKHESQSPKQLPASQTSHWQPARKDGGEDDDPVVILEKSVTETINGYAPLSDCDVAVSCATYTITGTTDEYGACKIYLPSLGQHHIIVSKQGYLPVDKDINVQDSVTNRTDTMLLQQ